MTTGRRRTYLLLLREPSAATRKQAYAHLRGLGLAVPVQHGQAALEILATAEQAQTASTSELFVACLKGTMKKEHLDRLTPLQRPVVEDWNKRVTGPGHVAVKRRELEGRSWGDPEVGPPAPYTAIDPAALHDVLTRFDIKPRPGGKERGRLEGATFEAFERRLTSKYDDPKLSGHLARLALRLPAEYQELLLRLPAEAVKELRLLAGMKGEGK